MSATKPSKFYLTTPIYYVNARPHIGHAYTTIVADVLARRHRLLGDDTFFLTGTDEHGQKIERSAAAAGIPPQQFADQVSKSFQDLWKRMGILRDTGDPLFHQDYIRTTDPRHQRGVQKLFSELYARGFIELRNYTGAYCVSDEAFIDAPVGTPCPDCGRLLEQVTEENFFFKLSRFQLPLLDLIEPGPNGEPATLLITPESRRNEVLSFLRGNVLAAAGATDSGAPLEPGAPFMAQLHRDMGGVVGAPSEPGAPFMAQLHRDMGGVAGAPSEPGAPFMAKLHRDMGGVVGAPLEPGAPFMAQLHRDMGGVAGAPLEPGAPFMAQLHRDMGGVRDPIAAHTALGTPYVPGALKDLSISRSSFTWGVPVPEPAASAAKQKHVIYVWLDALANYITALGYGSEDESLLKKFWPADLHLVGKEITRFHCVYWPAFLLALNPKLQHKSDENPPVLSLEEHKAWAKDWLPKQITAHGWLLFDNSKMSKSKGNIVRTETILDAFGTLCPPVHLSAPSSVPSTLEANPSPLEANPFPLEANPSALEANPSPLEAETSPLEASVNVTASAMPLSPPFKASVKGTASAVPPTTPKDAALAAEVRPPTPHERDLFASDVLRYFLLREIPFGQDGSFSFDALITRYNADLANGYGNLVSRTLSMIHKYFDGIVQTQPEPQTLTALISSLEESLARVTTGERNQDVETHDIWSLTDSFAKVISNFFDTLDFASALNCLQMLVATDDQMLTSQAPWKIDISGEDGRRQVGDTLYTAAESIRIITALLYPILPYATARVWAQLGLGDIEQAAHNGELINLQWGGLQPGTKLGPLSPIFPRADKGLAQIMNDMEEQNSLNPRDSELTTELDPTQPVTSDPSHPAAPPRTSSLDAPTGPLTVGGSHALTTGPHPTPSHTEVAASGIFANQTGATSSTASSTTQPPSTTTQITIDDFAKIELRVAQIVVAERIPKADKLLRLEVDLGPNMVPAKRQILSGIAEFYTPEELIGRRIVVITNLAPRKMRGLESHGMLLAASVDQDGKPGKPILATMAEDIALGARLK